ncbi:MAG: hypothetical protein MRY32_06605 [Rickettsiales bacterium]|nr:hypothetical protein [Rickettsiales bacterium]
MIAVCFDALKTYGKEPEQMGKLTQLFNMVLSDYTLQQVKDAFRYYVKHYDEVPTPANIARIIERGNKPPFSESVYIAITKKHPEERTGEDWTYMRDFEEFIISGRMS